ncbi:hypothetical protein ERX37_05185 [Macrococcus hajekii]|uniref:Uncharacterized protein n=1 Tax=Macrococcus hajekii TaxID=198482 RepID=A0A4R6BNN5_9STAP|nr:hypothetical protein [Macrococcus hajekii]TDM03479.1 hypothetical protein ERX37_05185 [Macrococcus hajekii]GGA99193.1 hypothetical protein GCM10007190_04040 [Macrococcus hajekii]
MRDSEAHVADVYMCFLPFQLNQWKKTGIDWLDARIHDYYIQKEQQLDAMTGDARIIGIPAGNPKRYTNEDELLLHDHLADLEAMHSVTVDLTTLASYMDVSGLYWTIKKLWSAADVLGYTEKLPEPVLTERQITADEMYQMLPLTYPLYEIEAFEWACSQPDKVLIILNRNLLESALLAADENTYILQVDFKDAEVDGQRIARNGEWVNYKSVRQAVIFDCLHYARQFKVKPIVLDYQPAAESVMTQYGIKRSSQTALDYRMQNPHYQLFKSQHRTHQHLSLNKLVDTYGETFTIIHFSDLLPFRYQTELLKELTADNK